MLTPGSPGQAFSAYWQDMDRCRNARAFWSLLHVTICLPDICAALQSENGETKGARYISWCDKYLLNPMLSGSERYQMRCKVLHQGRASGRCLTQPLDPAKPGRISRSDFCAWSWNWLPAAGDRPAGGLISACGEFKQGKEWWMLATDGLYHSTDGGATLKKVLDQKGDRSK